MRSKEGECGQDRGTGGQGDEGARPEDAEKRGMGGGRGRAE